MANYKLLRFLDTVGCADLKDNIRCNLECMMVGIHKPQISGRNYVTLHF